MRIRSLTARLIGLYAFRTILVAGIFVVLLVSLLEIQSDDSVSHRVSNTLIAGLHVQQSVVDVQDGLRGYVITHQQSYLTPYHNAVGALPGQLRSLRSNAMTRLQRRDVPAISAGIGSYLTTVAGPVVAAQGRLPRARELAVIAAGEQDVNRLRTEFTQLNGVVVALRAQRRTTVNGIVTRSIIVAAVGLGLSLAVELELFAFLFRSVLRPVRTVARAASRIAGGEASARVPTGGFGEVAVLADSFNAMADATQSHTAELEARSAELDSARRRLAHAVDVAEEASAMKSNFVANMSHEIRTPLNGLVGMLTLLAETPLEEDQRKFLDVAVASSDALMTVVGDVLDIAKIEAGRLEVEELDFDLHDAVESVCDLMGAAAQAKGLELQSFVHEDVPRAVQGDRTRVCQVLQNLVSNAVKFTAAGEVAVEVSVAGSTAGTVLVHFTVRDTGIGIDSLTVSHLFEPFTQAEVGTTREFGGTGLGLAISRELTQLMGGSIAAESSPGRGSTFSFEIPFAPARAPLPMPVPTEDLYGLRVLVVDDNATNRRVFQSYVASWGMEAIPTAAADEARRELREAADAGRPFQLALLDLNMVGESGIDLARHIKDTPELASTRVILLTSSSGPRGAYEKSGIRQQLTKPVRRARLLEAISAAMAPELGPVESVGESRSAAAPAPAPAASGRRILVAEDHEVNWMLIDRMLANRGHQAVHAHHGDEVLEMISKADFDLVLMDCQMPIRDGFDTTRELRRRERASDPTGVERLPIVAMTASAMPGTRERCLEAGMDDYMSKPLSPAAVDEILDRWLFARSGPQLHATAPGVHAAAPVTSSPADEEADGSERLDPKRLGELRRLFPDDQIRGMVEEMIDETSRDFSDLGNALEDGDQAKVASAAHRLRNTGFLIGSRTMTDAAAKLDHPPHPGQATVPIDDDAVAELKRSWQVAQVELAELAEMSPHGSGG